MCIFIYEPKNQEAAVWATISEFTIMTPSPYVDHLLVERQGVKFTEGGDYLLPSVLRFLKHDVHCTLKLVSPA